MKPIEADMVEVRMRDLAQTTVNQTISLFKGGIFALAAVVLLEIMTQSDGRLLLFVLWGGSFVLSLVSYNAHLNTSVLVFRDGVVGTVIVVMQMMAELMLFAALTPRYADQVWRFWVGIYAVFMLITGMKMVFFPMNRGLALTPAVKPLFDAVDRGGKRAGRIMIFMAPIELALAAFIVMLPKDSHWAGWLTLGFGLFAIVLSLNGLVGMHRERLMIERMLNQALAEKNSVS